MQTLSTAESPLGLLVGDSNHMQCQLLASALRRRPEFCVSACPFDAEAILRVTASSPIEVAILTPGYRDGESPDMSIVRRLHLAHPQIVTVLVLAEYDREMVVNAFRAGVKGLFCSTNPFRSLCKCIHSVHGGQVWANSEQMHLWRGLHIALVSLIFVALWIGFYFTGIWTAVERPAELKRKFPISSKELRRRKKAFYEWLAS